MIKTFLILLVSFFARANVEDVNLSDCRENQQWLNERLAEISSIVEQRDASDEITSLIEVAKNSCSPNIAQRLQKQMQPLMVEGLKNHIYFMRDEVERVSSFRAPVEEITEISIARQKLSDMGIKDIPRELSDYERLSYMTLGLKNSKQRKASCTDVDNRRPPLVELKKDGSIKRNNMRNQDSVGWCYAYAAADMLSMEVGQNVSAIDVANAYNNSKIADWFGSDESSMDGGLIDSAAHSALDRGLCLESQLPSSDYYFSESSKKLIEELKAIEELYDLYGEYTSDIAPGVFSTFTIPKTGVNLLKAHNEFKHNLVCGKIDSDWNQLFKSLNIDNFMDVIKSASSRNDFIDKLVSENCKPRLKLASNPTFSELGFFSYSETIWNKIDSELTKGNITGLRYFSDVLVDKYRHESGRHASLIVARRFNNTTQSCEYLIRNSWGTQCTQYDEDFECIEGNIWIPEEYIKPATYGVIYAE